MESQTIRWQRRCANFWARATRRAPDAASRVSAARPADIVNSKPVPMRERIESTANTINNVLPTKIDPTSLRFESNMRTLAELVAQIRNEEEKIREGGGAKAIESQHAKSRLTARE